MDTKLSITAQDLLRHPKPKPLPATNYLKVAVIGASGEIGQPLCMLLKENPKISILGMYDIQKQLPGNAIDVSHRNSLAKVVYASRKKDIYIPLEGAHIVVIAAGKFEDIPEKKLFYLNASIVLDTMRAITTYAPCAHIVILSNPVNALMALASEYMKKANLYNRRRIYGFNKENEVRASTFLSECSCVPPSKQLIPVIGGTSGKTIIPLISKACPPICLNKSARNCFINKLQTASQTVAVMKKYAPSLCVAYSAERFVNSLIDALLGYSTGEVQHAYVYNFCARSVSNTDYFVAPIKLGTCGIVDMGFYNTLTEDETKLIKEAVPIINEEIKMGVDFVEKRVGNIQESVTRCFF